VQHFRSDYTQSSGNWPVWISRDRNGVINDALDFPPRSPHLTRSLTLFELVDVAPHIDSSDTWKLASSHARDIP
jgi:hypothetical protein